MSGHEIHLELLMGRLVRGTHGKRVGRIEEVVAAIDGPDCFIEEFHAGSYAFFERLSAWSIGRAFLNLLGAQRHGGYRIPWNKLDLSNPERPELRCPVEELERLD